MMRPEYVRTWQSHVQRHRSDQPSPAGIARVLALYLWGAGERADTETNLARDLKDRVRRALIGQSLSPETLTWFIRAFEMSKYDEHALWATYASGTSDQVSGISNTLMTRRPLGRPQRHRTLALFERYTIDDEHSFVDRRTLHVIMALEDGVDSYSYNHEPDVDRIDVIHGGSVGSSFTYGNGLHGVDILLEDVLARGDTASIEYLATYPPGKCTATEVRRPAHGRSENVDIALRFDPAALPARLCWAVWSDHCLGDPIEEEPALLSEHGTVHRFVSSIERTVVGFRWEW